MSSRNLCDPPFQVAPPVEAGPHDFGLDGAFEIITRLFETAFQPLHPIEGRQTQGADVGHLMGKRLHIVPDVTQQQVGQALCIRPATISPCRPS